MFVKVREATVKEAVKAVKGESLDLQFSYFFVFFSDGGRDTILFEFRLRGAAIREGLSV